MWDSQRTGGKLLNSVEHACKRLDLGKTTIYELLKTNQLVAVKIGSKTLITEDSLQDYLTRLIETARSEAA